MNKLKKFSLVILLFILTFVSAQDYGNPADLNMLPVKTDKNLAVEPGIFKQILNAQTTIINPGDSIKIDHYITGNGYINYEISKIYFVPSEELIDLKKSFILSSFDLDYFRKTGLFTYGGSKHYLNSVKNYTLTPSSLMDYEIGSNRYFHSFFSQYRATKNNIFSELVLGAPGKPFLPPIRWEIITKKDIRPGDYQLNFVFTYFNGEKWMNDTSSVKIHIMPWYEKYASTIQVLGVVVIIFTLYTTVLSTISFFRIQRNQQN